MVERLKRVPLSTWIRVVGGISFLVVLIFLIPFGTVYQWFTFDHIVEWVKNSQSSAWTPLIFLGAFIMGVLGFPITIFPVVGGVLFGFWVAVPMNIFAATMGAWLAFGIARIFGRTAVKSFLRGRFKTFDQFTAHQGVKTVAILRWIGIPPFIVANYALGLSGINWKDYLIGTLIGISPWMILTTYLSSFLWEAALIGGEKGLVEAVITKMGPLMILSFLVLVVVGVKYYIKRRKNPAPMNYSNL